MSSRTDSSSSVHSFSEKKPVERLPLVEHECEKDMEQFFEMWEQDRSKVLVLVSMSAFLAPLTTTIYLPSLGDITEQLHSTTFNVTLTLSSYVLFLGLSPLLWGPLSDRYGRKYFMLMSLLLYLVVSALCGFSINVIMLIGLRALQAIAVSAVMVIGAAVITDIYPPNFQRVKAMGIFGISSLLGPMIGPVIGGIISWWASWRAIFWVLSGTSAPLFILILLFMPETRNGGASSSFSPRSFNPIKPLKLLAIPRVGFPALLHASTYAGMYCMLLHLAFDLEKSYKWDEVYVGLAFLPFGAGTMIGTIFGSNIATFARQKYGKGGSLLLSVAFSLGVCLCLICYGLFSWKKWVPLILIITASLGCFMTALRPGLLSFTMEERPFDKSDIMSCMLFFQFVMASAFLVLAPLIDSTTSKFVVFGLLALMVAICVLPVIRLTIMTWNMEGG